MERVEGRVGYQIKRAEHALRLEMDRVLRGLEVTTPQYAAMSGLEEEPGLSGAALARRSFVTPQTMNGILLKLEGAGLVERRPHPEHGRVLQAYITEAGEVVLAECHRRILEVEERMVADLSEGERSRLLESLRSCTRALQRKEKGAPQTGSPS